MSKRFSAGSRHAAPTSARARSAGALLLAVPVLSLAQDVTTLHGAADAIVADGWRVAGLETTIELTDAGIRADVRIGRLEVAGADIVLVDTVAACSNLDVSSGEFRCDDGRITADLPAIGRQTFAARFAYAPKSGTTQFHVPNLRMADGSTSLDGSSNEQGMVLHFSGDGLQLAGLLAIAQSLGADIDGLSASGRASLGGTLRIGRETELALEGRLDEAAVSNEAGTMVTDALHAVFDVAATIADDGWRGDIDITADRGEVYFEPVYANLNEHSLIVHAAGIRGTVFDRFAIDDFRIEQQTVITLTGSDTRVVLAGDAHPATSLGGRFELLDTSVEAAYTGLLKVLAAGTLFGDLETAGRVSGSLVLDDNTVDSVDVAFQDLILDDEQRRFAIYGLTGDIHLSGTDGSLEQASTSTLHWDSASAYNIPVDGSTLRLRLGDKAMQLLQPLRVPTMGGALLVHRLEVHDYGTDGATGTLDAELEPIQLGQLTGAFGWPAFSGSLAGRLPLLHYESGAMTVGGTLTARAFDGDIEVANLRLEQPFGRVPRLYGDLRVQQLDLERITSTFSFGLIQGRLSGAVTGLETVNWQPVAMDLHLYTPERDKSRHRISQRAVENLASVGGGGAAAALSSGLLGFFDVFAYDRIGIRCVLKNGVCAMSGTGVAGDGPAGSGYYIVKGSGLPRIDVVGYRSQVNWTSLLHQLASITHSEAPVVH